MKKKLKLILNKTLLEKKFPKGRQVDFIIIGAQKCGTTALFTFLNSHPKLNGAKLKELNFFVSDEKYKQGYNFYHNYFDFNETNNMYFEASPSYLQDNNFIAAERICQYNQDVKLIVMLRNPVERAYSAFNMYKKKFDKNPDWFSAWMEKGVVYNKRIEKDYKDFDFFINNEIEVLENNQKIECPVINHGKYYLGLKQYLKYFDKNQIYFVEDKSLLSNTHVELNKMIKWLGNLPEFDWPFPNGKKVHSQNYRKDYNDTLYNELYRYYSPFNEKLFRLIGWRFDWQPKVESIR